MHLNIVIKKGNSKIVSLLLEHPNIDVNKISRHNDCSFGINECHNDDAKINEL